jgi:hypothetical protein
MLNLNEDGTEKEAKMPKVKKDVITISPSRVGTFLDCPQKYSEQYLQPERPLDSPTLPKVFGSFVHLVLEKCLLYNNESNGLTQDDAELVLAQEFTKVFGAGSLEVVMKFSSQFNKAISDTLSYGCSIGKQYKSPQQTAYFAWRHRPELEELFKRIADVNTDMYSFYSDAHDCVVNFYSWFTSEGKGYEIIPELALDNIIISLPTLDSSVEVRYNGIMDVYMRKGDEIIVVDFKTNRTPYDADVINFSVQLGLYALAVKARFDIIPKVAYLELRQGKLSKREMGSDELERYQHFFAQVVTDMLEFTKVYKAGKKDLGFFTQYATRFPLSSAKTQGCPCDFVNKCVFKN